MIIIIFIILIIFIIALTAVWMWYVNSIGSKESDFYLMAKDAFDKKDYKQVETLLMELLVKEPNSKEARDLLGKTYLETKSYEKAKECFDKILKTSPLDSSALIGMATALENQDSYAEAKEFYEKVAQEGEDNTSINQNIAVLSLKQGNYQEAINLFEKVLEKQPENIQASFYLTKCKSEMIDYSSPEVVSMLIEEYQKMAGQPNLPKDFDSSLALVYCKSGQMDKALAACKRALEADSENIEAYKLLGLTQLINKDLNEAKSTIATGLSLDSKNEELHDLLSFVLCQQKNRCALKECRNKYKEAINKFLNKNNVNEV